MKAAVVALHGILTPTSELSWPEFLNDYLQDCKVERRRYFAGPISIFNVFFRNRRHAHALADQVQLLADNLPVHFVAHSNGCDIALKTIKILVDRGIRVETAIFTGSVTDPDVDRSGVYGLISTGMLGKAFAYCSKADVPLRIPIKWPYRNLGICGWQRDGKPYEDLRIRTRRYDTYGHSGYFEDANRDAVFAQMRKDMRLDERTDEIRRDSA